MSDPSLFVPPTIRQSPFVPNPAGFQIADWEREEAMRRFQEGLRRRYQEEQERDEELILRNQEERERIQRKYNEPSSRTPWYNYLYYAICPLGLLLILIGVCRGRASMNKSKEGVTSPVAATMDESKEGETSTPTQINYQRAKFATTQNLHSAIPVRGWAPLQV